MEFSIRISSFTPNNQNQYVRDVNANNFHKQTQVKDIMRQIQCQNILQALIRYYEL
jgi:hypothetical protein